MASLLEVHLQHQVALAKRLERLDSRLSTDITFAIGNRVFLATGSTKAAERQLCVRCFAFHVAQIPPSGVLCGRCGSIPRRRSKSVKAPPSGAGAASGHLNGPARPIAVALRPSPNPPPTGTQAPRSIFSVLNAAAPLPSLAEAADGGEAAAAAEGASNGGSAHALHTVSATSNTRDAALASAEPAPLAAVPLAAASQSADSPGDPLSDLLLSKSEKKRKRLQFEQEQLRRADAPAIPPASTAPELPPAGSLLAMLAASGLALVRPVAANVRPAPPPAKGAVLSVPPWGGAGRGAADAILARKALPAQGASTQGAARFSFSGARR